MKRKALEHLEFRDNNWRAENRRTDILGGSRTIFLGLERIYRI